MTDRAGPVQEPAPGFTGTEPGKPSSAETYLPVSGFIRPHSVADAEPAGSDEEEHLRDTGRAGGDALFFSTGVTPCGSHVASVQ